MDIFVKQIDGTVITLRVDVHDDMFEIKRKIWKHLGMNPEEQRLVFAGKQLENGRNLQDYCIQKESTLYLVERKKGSGVDLSPVPNPNTVKPLIDLTQWPRNKCLIDDSGGAKNIDWITAGGLGSLQLFTPEFAGALFKEIDHFCTETGDSGVALRMEYLGLDQFLDQLVRPAAVAILAGLKLKTKDDNFLMLSKCMRYTNAAGREGWPAHCDGDLGTLNICLGDGSFEGGELKVWSADGNSSTIDHRQVGSCIFHGGTLIHEVLPLKKGLRITLIIKLFDPKPW